uniref:Fe2OG dioxygenase domain-containing protein n=1 Tax=Kalanchoe fedtschenkoi TaxID=63787 RepID=A0A7N0RBR7_KALFE
MALKVFRDDRRSEGFSFWGNDKDAQILRLGYVKPEVITWSPRIIVLHNFLSLEECDYLRALAKPRLKVSTVVDAKTGKYIISLLTSMKGCSLDSESWLLTIKHPSCFLVKNGVHAAWSKTNEDHTLNGVKSNVRTSTGMFLNHEERKFPIIQAIEKRIAVYSQVPVEHGELIQVLRYEKSEFYKPHNDYFSDSFNIKKGGQRVATMLMYLSDNVEGGETYFPLAGTGECSCGGKTVKGVSVKPKKGDAVLFWSMGLDGQSDPNSLHGGCEVLSGVKWSATKWMRQKPAN